VRAYLNKGVTTGNVDLCRQAFERGHPGPARGLAVG
jgi:hypothetical protein